ncbi:SAM-dependent methyltransferase [Streptomyces sp. NPDC006552]
MRRFFDGLDLIEPGICCCHRWRPADPADAEARPAPTTGRSGSGRGRSSP